MMRPSFCQLLLVLVVVLAMICFRAAFQGPSTARAQLPPPASRCCTNSTPPCDLPSPAVPGTPCNCGNVRGIACY